MNEAEQATQADVGQIVPGPGFWTVRSVTTDASYVVRLNPPRCSCPHNRFRREACKHLKAVLAMAPARPVSWIGWLRESRAHPWLPVAEGMDRDAVEAAALEHPCDSPRAEVQVKPRGERPIGDCGRAPLAAAPTTAAWLVWERAGKADPWRVIAFADTEAEAQKASLNRPSPGQFSDVTVLPAQQRPPDAFVEPKAEVLA